MQPIIVASSCALAFVCLACLSLILLILPSNTNADDTSRSIVFVLSGDSPVYNHVAKTTEEFILHDCNSSLIECNELIFDRQSHENFHFADLDQTTLTIALGIKATNQAERLQQAGNQLHAMLPYIAHSIPHSNESREIADIYIDQPYIRYFNLIKATIPRARRVGLLIHESNLDQIDNLTKTASQQDFTLKTSVITSERDVGEAISYLLNDIDVLLALPDSRIHNSQTISHILTTAYRNSIPVIGFSSAYVKAGATAAVYTSLDDISHQVSDTVLEFLTYGYVKNRSQQAKYFSVAFNFEVARSLGLPPISPSEIKHNILEGGSK
jgi:hypothetical protein